MLVVPTGISFINMPLSTEDRCFQQQWLITPFPVCSIFVQSRQLNSGVAVAGILVQFSVVGVVDVKAGVEASSEACDIVQCVG